MAKNKSKDDTTETAEPKKSRAIMLTVDGEEIKRTDFIRNQWATKEFTRREIADQLSELQGKEVPYQIVFQATKGLEGGAPKVEKAVAEEASTDADAEAEAA